jgi:hypothetical protein
MNSDKAWAFDVHAFYIVVAHWMVRSAPYAAETNLCAQQPSAWSILCTRQHGGSLTQNKESNLYNKIDSPGTKAR